MTFILELPDSYGYVLAAAASTFFINTLHSVLTSKARKASGIKYPTTYATTEQAEKDPKAYKFNCAQRAHANFTENHTSFLGALLIAGLRFPCAAGYLGAGWAISRILYALGYVSSGPAGRAWGSITGSICDISLKLMAGYTAAMFALAQ